MTTSNVKGNEVLLENTVPFWFLDKQVKFPSRRTVMFLELYGWGYFQAHEKRTVKKELFHNDSDVLRIHNEETAKKWMFDFLESLDKEVFLGGILQTPEGVKQYKVLDAWINLSNDQWKKILGSSTVYSEENYQSTEPINVFRHSEENCHIRFSNGVCKITANDIEVI